MAMFITFEGGEGSGKTTQISLLSKRLNDMGKSVVSVREPGSAPGAEAIRDLVLNGSVDRWHPIEELLLFSAARHELVRTKIKPALAAGKIVLCDRFADSSAVYQGRAGGVQTDQLQVVETLATDGLQPDLTFLIDVPIDVGLSRADKRILETVDGPAEARFEGKDISFHQRVRDAFLDRAREHAHRFRVVDGSLSIEALADKIWHQMREAADR